MINATMKDIENELVKVNNTLDGFKGLKVQQGFDALCGVLEKFENVFPCFDDETCGDLQTGYIFTLEDEMGDTQFTVIQYYKDIRILRVAY